MAGRGMGRGSKAEVERALSLRPPSLTTGPPPLASIESRPQRTLSRGRNPFVSHARGTFACIASNPTISSPCILPSRYRRACFFRPSDLGPRRFALSARFTFSCFPHAPKWTLPPPPRLLCPWSTPVSPSVNAAGGAEAGEAHSERRVRGGRRVATREPPHLTSSPHHPSSHALPCSIQECGAGARAAVAPRHGEEVRTRRRERHRPVSDACGRRDSVDSRASSGGNARWISRPRRCQRRDRRRPRTGIARSVDDRKPRSTFCALDILFLRAGKRVVCPLASPAATRWRSDSAVFQQDLRRRSW
jgi:hypothetical protein